MLGESLASSWGYSPIPLLQAQRGLESGNFLQGSVLALYILYLIGFGETSLRNFPGMEKCDTLKSMSFSNT